MATGESFSEHWGVLAANQKNAPVNSQTPANGTSEVSQRQHE
jgi:hypothetical protein